MNEVELTIICLATTAYVSQSQRWKKIEKKKEAIDRDTRVALRNIKDRCAGDNARVPPCVSHGAAPGRLARVVSTSVQTPSIASLIETP